MGPATRAEERAQWLLDRMRETPMRRGALSRRARQLTRDLSQAMRSEGVPGGLADRVAFQLAFKFDRRDLFDEPEWRAIGRILVREIAQLKNDVGMSPPRIIATLPKLSAAQVREFLHELTSTDRRIARTILHAAVNTSEPLTTGRRFLAEYRTVVRKLRGLEPATARSIAAATFSASAPLSKAMEHLKR